MELYFSLARCLGPGPNSSNNDFVSICNHVSDINREIRNLLQQNLQPLRTFLQIIPVVTLQFMIVKVRSHIPKNDLNVPTVHRFEVTLYKFPVCAWLIHFSLRSSTGFLSLAGMDEPPYIRMVSALIRVGQELRQNDIRCG